MKINYLNQPIAFQLFIADADVVFANMTAFLSVKGIAKQVFDILDC